MTFLNTGTRTKKELVEEAYWMAEQMAEVALVCAKMSGEKKTSAEMSEMFPEGVGYFKEVCAKLRDLSKAAQFEAKRWREIGEAYLD